MIFEKLNKILEKQKIDKNELVPVAFSGGPDSTFLAYGLITLGYKPLIIYVNYHDSPTVNIEEDIILNFVKEHNLPFVKKDVYITDNVNFENTARIIRYTFFKEELEKHNCNYILTAHHKNDDAETLMLQLQRKNLVDYYGLKTSNTIYGIRVIRPLLKYTKKDIVNYLNEEHISFYDDPTNYQPSRQRNKLRLETSEEVLLSILRQKKELNIALAKTYSRINDLLKNKEIYREDYLNLFEDEQKRLLFSLIKNSLPFSEEKDVVSLVNKIRMRLKTNKTFEEPLNNELSLYGSKETIFIAKTIENNEYSYRIDEPGVYDFNELSIDISDPSRFNIKSFPIFITNVKEDDVISTNMKQNSVKRFLKKQHVPLYLKKVYPAIRNEKDEVFYIPFYEDIIEEKIPLSLNFFTSKEHKDGKDVL